MKRWPHILFAVAAVSLLAADGGEKKEPPRRDDPQAVAALEKADVRLERDSVGNVISAQIDAVEADKALPYLKGLPHLHSLGLDGISDSQVAAVMELTSLRALSIDSGIFTDEGMKHIGRLTHLETLGVDAPKVTDEGIAHLAKLGDLTMLDLNRTRITDNGLVHIGALKKLQLIDLSYSEHVTDAGLLKLRGLKELERVIVRDTAVTRAGANELRVFLPGVRVSPFEGKRKSAPKQDKP